ncbi:MAG: hypothetical protein DWI29_03690 [Planctomycetota bacterium]|nr:MAG: hypothetical protein DWI29_03690 [Planctomycetota bacterium]
MSATSSQKSIFVQFFLENSETHSRYGFNAVQDFKILMQKLDDHGSVTVRPFLLRHNADGSWF